MIYTARYILTQDASRTIFENAALRVVGTEIADVGPAADVRARAPVGEPVFDLGDAAILPGLINAHAHLAHSVLRGLGEDKALMAWLTEDIFPREAKLTHERIRIGALMSCAELIRTGCTAVFDMYLMQEATFNAVDAAGLRGILTESGCSAFPTFVDACEADLFARLRDLAARWKGHPRIRLGVSAHAIYSTEERLLRALRDLADELAAPFSMHMAETTDEENGSLRAHGLRPVAYADSLGLLRADTALAHCVHVNDADIAILAARGCVPVHNPASNLKLGSGIAPVAKMLRAGLPVSLGTDGAASNNAQNLFRELYLAALLGKLSGNAFGPMFAQDALDMATRNGAAALFDPSIGSLEVGKKADFCALDLSGPSFQPLNRVLADVVYACSGLENRLTVVDGRELYRDGVFTTLDYDDLRARAKVVANDLA